MEAPGKLSPTVKRLGWVSFFTDVASEMAYPLVPLFLTNALRAPAMVVGGIEGIAEGIVNILKALSGMHSDWIRRRVPYIRWGYGLSAFSKPLLALAFTWPTVLLARALDRTGKGIRATARDALIADVTDRSLAGKAFGLHRAMDTAGALLGVIAAAALLKLLPEHYRTIFLIAAVPGLISVAITFSLRDPSRAAAIPPVDQHDHHVQGSHAAAADGRGGQAIAADGLGGQAMAADGLGAHPALGLPPAYWRNLSLLLLFALANSSDAFLLLRARSLGLSSSATVAAYAMYNLSYSLISYPAGVLSDRIGRWRIIGMGWFVYALAYCGFAVANRPIHVWGLFLLYGIYMGATDGVGKALIASQAPAGRRATALGIFQMSLGFAALLSSFVAGLLWDRISPAAPFWFGGITALVAVALLPFFVRTAARAN